MGIDVRLPSEAFEKFYLGGSYSYTVPDHLGRRVLSYSVDRLQRVILWICSAWFVLIRDSRRFFPSICPWTAETAGESSLPCDTRSSACFMQDDALNLVLQLLRSPSAMDVFARASG